MPSNELEITDTTSSLEEAPDASGDTPARAERRDTGTESTVDERHAAAETRTRQDYADDMRGQGQPIPAADHPGRDTAPADQPGRQARDTPASDQTSTPDLAEPRDRQTYAHDIRTESASPTPDSAPVSDRTTATGGSSPDAESHLADQPRPEQTSREPDEAQERGEVVPDRYEESTDAGWPSQADRDHWHAMYQEFLDDARSGRDQRAGAVSEKPDPPPADTWGVPPTGEELLEIEPEESRAEAFRREFYKPETIEGLHDTFEQNADDAPLVFERPPMGSQADVPSSIPQVSQQTPEGISADHLAMAGLVVGVLAFEFGRWIHRKIDK
jgi:hypothetical protein